MMVDEFIGKHNQAQEYIDTIRSMDEFAKILQNDTLIDGKLSIENRGNKELLHEKAYAAIKNSILDLLMTERVSLKKKIDDLYED